MGRRALGRKYAKHISIQVNEEHNDDLKLLSQKLNQISPLPHGKKWTIRDIILTLLYSQHDNSSDWYSNNHFEQIPQSKLLQIRNLIRSNGSAREPSKIEKRIEVNHVSKQQLAIKKTQISKPSLKIKINADYQTYIDRIQSIQTDEVS